MPHLRHNKLHLHASLASSPAKSSSSSIVVLLVLEANDAPGTKVYAEPDLPEDKVTRSISGHDWKGVFDCCPTEIMPCQEGDLNILCRHG